MITEEQIEHRAAQLHAGVCCHCLACGSTFTGHLGTCAMAHLTTPVARVVLADFVDGRR